jgi:2-polyprenyl-6-methoxyphenol hydroxylase-like FAD-dependent oxidoreductase
MVRSGDHGVRAAAEGSRPAGRRPLDHRRERRAVARPGDLAASQQHSAVRRKKALIAGAGIAGLAAGIALRRAGLEVELFERAPELHEIGAGLSIWPNGTAALRDLDVEIRALPVGRLAVRTWRGRQLTELPVDVLQERYGSQMLLVHRADLQAGLSRTFGKAGIRFDADVVGFADEEDTVRVRLRSGDTAEGDLLLGADGLRSAVRCQLLGDGPPVYLGSTIWRGLVHPDGIDLEPGQGLNWVGRGGEFLAFHLAGDQIYWAGVAKAPEGERAASAGHKSDLLDRFSDWEDLVPAVISATDEQAILRNDMYDRPPTLRWTAGKVALIGDAAHPMTPNAGQGACQALEDAVAVGESLATESDVVGALQAYQRRRVARANSLVKMSRQATRAAQFENGILCSLRDATGRLLPRALLLRILDRTMAPSR